MLDLKGQVALVTGGGSGIGRAVCSALAARGAFVCVTDFDKGSADQTVDAIVRSGGAGQSHRLDVRLEEDWVAALEAVDALPDGLKILVNCAGKSIIAETFTMKIEDLRSVLAVNVEGTFLGMKHAIPRIAASGGGSVVNMSSALALKGVARMAAYCGSKAAIGMMSKAVALECAELGNKVRVNSVHPGVVDTPAWHKHGPEEVGALPDALAGGAVLDVDDVARKIVPLGIACSAGEVAETICFLVSDAARHMTGTEVVIDGGMTAG